MRTDYSFQISSFFRAIRLGFGLRRLITKPYIQFLKRGLDNVILYPLYRILETYFFHSIVWHYGADYRWGDDKSHNLDKSTSNLGFGLLHYALIRNFRPKRVLCVGSMYGYIPYMMARGLDENRIGFLDFVDAGFDANDNIYHDKHYFGQGFWKTQNAHQHFSYLLDPARIRTHVETLEEFLRHADNAYDYVFLDGDHSYNGMFRDIRLVWPRIRKGGILILHDIEFDFQKLLKHATSDFRAEAGELQFGVRRIWKQVMSDSVAFPILNGYSGLGLVMKTSQKSKNTTLFRQHQ